MKSGSATDAAERLREFGHPLEGVELKIIGERIAIRTAALLSGYLSASASLWRTVVSH